MRIAHEDRVTALARRADHFECDLTPAVWPQVFRNADQAVEALRSNADHAKSRFEWMPIRAGIPRA
jgi:hypothetical protein